MTCVLLICTSVTIIGSSYAVFAALQLRKFFAGTGPARPPNTPSVTLLKPLCGAEIGLYDNLASFCAQDYSGPLQIVFGTQDPADPAGAVATRLTETFPKLSMDLVVDAKAHGANRKISNVINMMALARHDIVVLSDSDMRVSPAYLRSVVTALEAPRIGLVTCLYRGLPAAGVYSRLAAAEIDHRFLPNILVGLRLGLATPCFGSTIALSAETLRAIGGFEAFADQLADDYAIGKSVRELGLEVAIPPIAIDHICAEASFGELVRHELRWARTIRLVDPWGYAGSVVTHPLPFALAAAALQGVSATSALIVTLALACRLLIPLQVAKSLGGARVPLWLSPVRDLLSFAIFLASFFPAPVSWRGHRYRVARDGRLTPI